MIRSPNARGRENGAALSPSSVVRNLKIDREKPVSPKGPESRENPTLRESWATLMGKRATERTKGQEAKVREARHCRFPGLGTFGFFLYGRRVISAYPKKGFDPVILGGLTPFSDRL
jgi:hypothetical protein